MPLFNPKPATFDRPRSLVASAAKVRMSDRKEMDMLRQRRSGTTWQDEVWEYYDAIGEIKYALNLVAAVVSRLRLYAGVVLDPGDIPVPVTEAVSIDRTVAQEAEEGLAESNGNDQGIDPQMALDARDVVVPLSNSRMLYSAALNVQIPGEFYLLARPDRWQVLSSSELSIDGSGRMSIKTSGTAASHTEALDKDAAIGRVWRPHPRYSMDPDSSMKALRSDCEELLLLTRMLRTTVRSRMNAGILFVPDSMTVAATSVPEEEGDRTEEDVFEAELVAAMTEPVADESHASAVVPMLIRGPAELGDTIKHLSLGRDVSSQLSERVEKVMERILQGLDVPKEIVQGLANIKYSNALVINEGMYKATIEPLAVLLCDALTDIVLRPILRAQGYPEEDVSRVVVWYDPSEVVTRPDPSESATQGFDRMVLSADAWRRSHGFSDADAPDEEELARRLAVDKSQIPPEIAQVLLQALLPEILGQAREQAAEGQLPDELRQALGEEVQQQPQQPAEPAEPAEPEPPGLAQPVQTEQPSPNGQLPPVPAQV